MSKTKTTLYMSDGETDYTAETTATDLVRAAKRAWPYARDYADTCKCRVYDEETGQIVEEFTF